MPNEAQDLNPKSKIENTGFTLIELLLYIIIVAIISGVIAQTLVSITTTHQKIGARKIVDENLDFALKKIETDLRNSNAAEVNAAGDTLTLTLKNESIVEFSVDESGILQKNVGGVNYPITSDKVIVTKIDDNNPLFSKVEQSSTTTIQIKLKVKYNSQDPKLSAIANQAQTTISLR